ncbi:hypothetical protein [Propionivibrio soli]|uniref:hypothetical protein n=1 Tax=Propionivibrio soli TaxID=2976531 RepID=UPI0021E6E410|nr:hypothetical protein [Propionivibrio soli]
MTSNIVNRNLGILVAACVVGWYSSTFFFLLLFPSLLIYWLARRFLSPKAATYAISIAAQSAQVAVSTAFLPVLFSRIQVPINLLGLMVDTVVPITGLVWLVIKPGLKPVVFLSVFQVSMLVFNGYVGLQLPIGDSQHKAVVAHIFWRVEALIAMWSSLMNYEPSNAKTIA